jgi:bifunctional enzyme CysN/CysC
LRLPIQHTILPKGPGNGAARCYAGHLACGSLSEGDEVLVLPAGTRTRVASLYAGGRPLSRAQGPVSITIGLSDELDVARGDMLANPAAPPRVASELEASVCWMSPVPLSAGSRYLLRQTTVETRCVVDSIAHKLDISAHREIPAGDGVGLNDFAVVRLRTSRPVCMDAYRENRATGSFILIDEATNATMAAGMIL